MLMLNMVLEINSLIKLDFHINKKKRGYLYSCGKSKALGPGEIKHEVVRTCHHSKSFQSMGLSFKF